MGLGEISLGEMGLGEMGLGEMGQNPVCNVEPDHIGWNTSKIISRLLSLVFAHDLVGAKCSQMYDVARFKVFCANTSSNFFNYSLC